MRAREIGVVLLKLWGVMLLVQGALTLVTILPMVLSPSDPNVRFALMGNGLNGIVALIAGVGVLLGADAIPRAIGITGQPEGNAPAIRYTVAELQSLIFGGLGVYFLIAALRDIGTLVYTIARKPAWDPSNALPYLFQHAQNDLVGAAVQLVAAILLLVNRTMLAHAWHRMRPMTTMDRDE